MLKVTEDISEDDLIDKILGCYESEDDNNVIILWENYSSRDLNFDLDGDRQLCDALSHSYLIKGLFDKSLIFIDQRIEYMKRDIGMRDRADNNGSNLNFYFNMKIFSLSSQNKSIQLHATILEYFALGGNHPSFKDSLDDVRSKIFQTYFGHIGEIFSLIFVSAIVLVKFNLSSTPYLLFQLLGGALIIFTLLFKGRYKKLIFKLLDWDPIEE